MAPENGPWSNKKLKKKSKVFIPYMKSSITIVCIFQTGMGAYFFHNLHRISADIRSLHLEEATGNQEQDLRRALPEV